MPIGGTAFFGMNQHPRITTNYINQLGRTGDPGAGVNVSTAQMSGSIVQEYLGFAGGKLTITNPFAGGGGVSPQSTQSMLGDPRVGPIYGGVYQYVRLDPKATAPLVRGAPVFWLDELNYIVTAAGQSTDATPVPHKLAGVALNSTLPGYWDFIQIMGIASVLFSGAGTIGQLASVTPTATPPTVTAGTTLSSNLLGVIVLTAAVSGQVSPVELNILQGYNF